jgi:hypothetical protein
MAQWAFPGGVYPNSETAEGAMELPQTNFDPPFNVTRASHLVLTSRDLAKAAISTPR